MKAVFSNDCFDVVLVAVHAHGLKLGRPSVQGCTTTPRFRTFQVCPKAGSSGPFWTAASASSNCCGVAIPTFGGSLHREAAVWRRQTVAGPPERHAPLRKFELKQQCRASIGDGIDASGGNHGGDQGEITSLSIHRAFCLDPQNVEERKIS